MFPPFLFLHLLFESLLSKKSLFFACWGYVIYSPWLCSRSAEGCTAPWKSPEGSLCRRARAQGAGAELGSGGLQKESFQGGGLGINLKARFCVFFSPGII